MDNILVINKLEEFVLNNPDFTVGECLYSVFRYKNSGIREMKSVKEFREIENNDIFTAIERAIRNEEK